MDVGQRIRAWRKDKQWTQGDLARRAGVSKAAVSLWETGGSKGLKLDNLVTVADAFGVSIRELITGDAPAGRAAPQPQRVIDSGLVADILAVVRALWEPYPTDDELAILIAESYARIMLQTHETHRATIREILLESRKRSARAINEQSPYARQAPTTTDNE